MVERYDPEKGRLNRDKHGLPLIFGERISDDPARIVTPTIREGDEEDRFKVIGVVDGKLYTAVFTWRLGLPRYISVRRSNGTGERRYRDSR